MNPLIGLSSLLAKEKRAVRIARLEIEQDYASTPLFVYLTLCDDSGFEIRFGYEYSPEGYMVIPSMPPLNGKWSQVKAFMEDTYNGRRFDMWTAFSGNVIQFYSISVTDFVKYLISFLRTGRLDLRFYDRNRTLRKCLDMQIQGDTKDAVGMMYRALTDYNRKRSGD